MLQIFNFSKLKRTIVWMLFGIMGYANVCAQSQDTLYITSTSALVQLQWRTNVKNILVTNINCDTLVAYGQGTQIIIKDVQTEVQRFLITSFIFKINGSVVTGSDSIYTEINNLNAGVTPTMKLYQVYRVVDSIPVPPDANTTYLIGTQDTILIDNLDGDRDKFYSLKFLLVNPGANDLMTMRFNNVATNAYDYRYAYAGSTSTQVASNTNRIGIGSVQSGNTLTTLDFDIYAQTGVNRMIQWQQGITQASQATIGLPLIGNAVWKNNSTNMTSIRFGSDTPTVIDYGVGTIVYVYRLN
jgi:hypothetical protein